MSNRTHKPKLKEIAQAVANKLPKGLPDEQKAFLESFEADFDASHRRIQALKAETDVIAQKTDTILAALA